MSAILVLMDEATRTQLQPGARVKVTQQIAGRDYTWTSQVRGTVVGIDLASRAQEYGGGKYPVVTIRLAAGHNARTKDGLVTDEVAIGAPDVAGEVVGEDARTPDAHSQRLATRLESGLWRHSRTVACSGVLLPDTLLFGASNHGHGAEQ